MQYSLKDSVLGNYNDLSKHNTTLILIHRSLGLVPWVGPLAYSQRELTIKEEQTSCYAYTCIHVLIPSLNDLLYMSLSTAAFFDTQSSQTL